MSELERFAAELNAQTIRDIGDSIRTERRGAAELKRHVRHLLDCYDKGITVPADLLETLREMCER